MRMLHVIEFFSLDGVMQAPGAPDEDKGGFRHGGWQRPVLRRGAGRDGRRGNGRDRQLPVRTKDVRADGQLLADGSKGRSVREAPEQHREVRGLVVDEYFLAVFPIVLGSGKRLFREIDQARHLRLVDLKPTSTGGVVLTYRPASGGA